MKRKFLALAVVVSMFYACGEKSKNVKTMPDEKKKQVLERAKANFDELEAEADKPVDQLTLPETKEQAIKTSIKPKPKPKVKERPVIKQPDRPTVKKETISTKYPMKNGYPIWFYNPNYGGYIGAVGIAKKPKRGGYPEQKRLAIMIAQANLAKQIKLIVNASVYTEKLKISKKDFDYYKSKISSLSKQEASQYFRNTKVMDEWINPKTGELFVWLVLEK